MTIQCTRARGAGCRFVGSRARRLIGALRCGVSVAVSVHGYHAGEKRFTTDDAETSEIRKTSRRKTSELELRWIGAELE